MRKSQVTASFPSPRQRFSFSKSKSHGCEREKEGKRGEEQQAPENECTSIKISL